MFRNKLQLLKRTFGFILRSPSRVVLAIVLLTLIGCVGIYSASVAQPPQRWQTALTVARNTVVDERPEVAPAKFLSITARCWETYTQVDEAAKALSTFFERPEENSKTPETALAIVYQYSLRVEEEARQRVLSTLLKRADSKSKEFLLALIKADLYRAILFARCENGYGLTAYPPRGDVQKRLHEIYEQRLVGLEPAQFPSLVRIWIGGHAAGASRQNAYEWLTQFAQLAPFESPLRTMLTGEPTALSGRVQYDGLLRELADNPVGQSSFNTANEVYNETRNQKAIADINKRIDTLVARVEALESGQGELTQEVEAIKARVTALEQWQEYVENEVILSGKLTFTPRPSDLPMSQQNDLLQALAPVLVTAHKSDFPLISPSKFARHSRIVHVRALDGESWLEAPLAPGFDESDPIAQIHERAKSGQGTEELVLQLRSDFIGNGWFIQDAARNEAFNRAAMHAGQGVLGAVRSMGATKILVQYFALLTHNTTADAPYGNHTGDWICVEFVIDKKSLPDIKVALAIFHNHGRQLQVQPDALRFDDTNHPMIWLEEGSNEPWPVPGTRGFSGYPPKGLKVNKMFPDGEDYGSEHKVVRHHKGEGFQYHTAGAVIDVLNDPGEDAQVVREFKGMWGGHWQNFDPNRDVFPGLGVFVGGYSTESPKSPLFQDKMWMRNFDQSWLSPPWTGSGTQAPWSAPERMWPASK